MSAGVGLRMRTLLVFILAVAFGAAWASNCTQYRSTDGSTGGQSGWVGSAEEACAAVAVSGTSSSPTSGYTVSVVSVVGGRCNWKVVSNYCMSNGGTEASCAGNTSSEVTSRTGDYCANPCVAGQHSTLAVTTGWARTSTPNASDIVVDFWTSPGAITAQRCDGQCLVNFGALKSAYRSQVPAPNGLHRLSSDVDVVATGGQCSTKSSDADPLQPPSSCPGYVGEVNGKKVCVGTGNTPLPQGPKPGGTPPDTPGNPAAGPKPTTGPGSGSDGPGRTPLVGDGGNAGGGSSAATPGGGSEGNGQVVTPGTGGGTGGGTEINVETCGLPGKAPCKIDEGGTPDGHGALDGANASLEAAKTASTGAVTAAGSQVTGLAWLWGFGLPAGTCTVLSTHTRLGDLVIDVCNSQAVALWRSVAGYMLFILGALYIWRSATSSTPGGK